MRLLRRNYSVPSISSAPLLPTPSDFRFHECTTPLKRISILQGRHPPNGYTRTQRRLHLRQLVPDSLNFLKDKPLRSRNSYDREAARDRRGQRGFLAIVLSVPQWHRAASKGEGWLKAGTRLNGNWGIPERRAKTGALVSTESSSAERANTGVGRTGVNGGLRVDVRCLATHPFSQHPLWTRRHHQRRCHVTNTDYAAASTFSTSADLDFPLYPSAFSFPRPPSLFSSSALLRIVRPTLNAASSIIQAPDAQPLSLFVGFSVSTCLGSCFFLFFFLFPILPRGEGDLGRVTGAREGEFRCEVTVGKLEVRLRNGSSANVAIIQIFVFLVERRFFFIVIIIVREVSFYEYRERSEIRKRSGRDLNRIF